MSSAVLFIVGGMISIGVGIMIYRDIKKQEQQNGEQNSNS